MAWKNNTTESLAIPLVRIRSATADDLSESSPSRSPRIIGDQSTPRTLSFDETTDRANAKLFLGDKLSEEEHSFKNALQTSIKKFKSYRNQEQSQEYCNFLQQIEEYYKQIIDTSTEELYSNDKIGEIVFKLYQFNQQWKKTWPGKRYSTKVLLQSCRLSRLSQFNASKNVHSIDFLYLCFITGINRSKFKC